MKREPEQRAGKVKSTERDGREHLTTLQKTGQKRGAEAPEIPSPQEAHDPQGRGARLNAAIASYLRQAAAGQEPDEEEWLRQHPDLAEELAEYFGDERAMASLAGSLRGLHASLEQVDIVRELGDYILEGKLGQGGMGVVYAAMQRSLNRPVAVKLILSGKLASASELERFQREATHAAQLQHPNIVRVYEVGEVEGQHYFAMERIHGHTLAEALRDGPLEPRLAAQYLVTIAHGVHYAHERGIVHRDLKPANILLDEDDVPKISDFGLAKRIEDESNLTQTGALLGTPGFMSPEQAENKEQVGPPSDVYSLGAILYATLTGRPPFQAAALVDALRQTVSDEPIEPRRLNSAIPRDIETICLKCLAKEPARRYESAAALADDLERFLADEPIEARPVTRTERMWRWGRRNPVPAALSGGILLTLLIGLAGVTWQWQRAVIAGDRERKARQEATDMSESLRQNLESARLQHAGDAWYRSDLGQVRELLAELPAMEEKSARFDRRLLEHLAWPPSDRYSTGHAHVKDLAYAPQGTWFAVALSDARVVVFRAADRQAVATLDGLEESAESVAFSPDGNLVAAGDAHGTVHVWNWLDSRATVQRVPVLGGPVRDLAFDPGGHRLLAGGGRRPFLGEQALGPGLLLGQAALLEAPDWEISEDLEDTPSEVTEVAFAPGGEFLVTACGSALSDPRPPTVHLWDAATLEHLRQWEAHESQLFALSVPDDGEVVTAGLENDGDGSIRFWDAATGAARRTMEMGRDLPFSVGVSVERDLVAAGSQSAFYLFRYSDGAPLGRRVGDYGLTYHLEFSPASPHLITGRMNSDVRRWDLKDPPNPVTLGGFDGWVTSLEFNRTGTRLFAGEQLLAPTPRIRAWNTATWEEAWSVDADTDDIYSLAVSRDDELLAVGCGDGSLQWRRTETGELIETVRQHEVALSHVAFSPSSPLLATGDGRFQRMTPDGRAFDNYDRPGTVLLWDTGTRRVVERLGPFSAPVTALTFTVSGEHLVVGLADGHVEVWSLSPLRSVHSIRTQAETLTSATLSRDGRLIAVAGADQRPDDRAVIRLIDTASWTLLEQRLVGHSNFVSDMVFAPDGTLASSSFDGTIRFWNVAIGQPGLVLRGMQVDSLALAPDGESIAAGHTGGRKVRVWHVADSEGTEDQLAMETEIGSGD